MPIVRKLYEKDKTYRFPLYWNNDPISIMGHDPHKLSTTERDTFVLLNKFCVMKVCDLDKFGDFLGIVISCRSIVIYLSLS